MTTTVVKPTWDRQVDLHGGVITVTWAGMNFATLGSVGDPVELSEFSGKTFQASGNYATNGAVAIEGSNDGTNWAGLHDMQGNVISFTGAAMLATQDAPRWIRPKSSAGTDGAEPMAVAVVVTCHRRDLGVEG